MCPAGPKKKAAKVLAIVVGLMLLFVCIPTAEGQIADVRTVSLSPTVSRNHVHPADYDRIMTALASILREKFELPVSQPKLFLYSSREAFESNLVKLVRFDPVYAREVAGWAAAVGAPEMVLANEEALERVSWPERIRVLAHELVHTVQYGLTGGRRGTSDQWLREGFADWIAYRVLESLDMGSLSSRRALLLARIKGTARRSSCAPLSDLVTLEDFTKSRGRLGGSSVYGESLLATELLAERHGVQSILHYFSLFKQSEDRLRNFRTAFNEDLPVFEKEFLTYLETSR